MKCLLPSVSRCSQVLQVSGVLLSLSTAVLRQLFCFIPVLRLLVSTLVCPAAYKSCTGEQQAELWRVGSDAWTSFLSPGRWQSDRQTDRSTPWLAVCQAMLKGWGHCSLQHGMPALSGVAQIFTDSFNGLGSPVPVLSEYSVFSHSFQISPLPFVFFCRHLSLPASWVFFMLLNAHIPILFANSKLLISFNHCFRVHLVEAYSSLCVSLMCSFLPSISSGF